MSTPAIMGALTDPLAPGPTGRWDHANTIRVELADGDLSGRPDDLIFNGANAAAVMTQSGEWEILQFADAELQGDGSWLLSRLLRAQLGTVAAMASGAAAGATFVLLDEAVTRVDLTTLENGLTLNWRAGPLGDPVASQTHATVSHAHAAIAARPLSPVHLSAARSVSGDIELEWVRRSRLDADDWDPPDIPLGETSERYRVDIFGPGDAVLRSIEVDAPAASYSAASQTADFGALPTTLDVSVVQLAGNGMSGSANRTEFSL